MKLLVVTQEVDRSSKALAFFVDWIISLSEHVERLEVICLRRGDHENLPDNVSLHSLGKERGNAKLSQVLNFYRLIASLEYDAALIHMNQVWAVLGFPVFLLRRVPRALWYAHKSVPLLLRLAVPLVHAVFTPTKESFRLRTSKLKVLHHGIPKSRFAGKRKGRNEALPVLLQVGRVAPSKHQDWLILAAAELKKRGVNVMVRIVGGPINKADEEYLSELKKLKRKSAVPVDLVGHVDFSDVPKEYSRADVFVNCSTTGSLDKVVVEAALSGLPVVACQPTYYSYFGNYVEELSFEPGDIEGLADTLEQLLRRDATPISATLKEHFSVHDLDNLSATLVQEFERLKR